ncbi:hypothetical protein [Algoriphagus halophytocola]|uniref:Uncharacterized protein n=1 Tax=Algoriphagus halophytocola TaxID=2991499 RepID=A0ABY6MD02_9BACT|nr:hypothetical protein [Algoriphagus sp. TR-M5]UZD21590.1 hypothetical protein OM944_13065 [Algoriphagus sp. TR-M5]
MELNSQSTDLDDLSSTQIINNTDQVQKGLNATKYYEIKHDPKRHTEG